MAQGVAAGIAKLWRIGSGTDAQRIQYQDDGAFHADFSCCGWRMV
jgi:hypothetical protein